MESKNLEKVKQLIERISDSYGLPTKKQVEKMRNLTGIDWSAEDLQMQCCEYWSHNSLDETAYFMFHGNYPPVRDVNLIFWKYKPGVVMDAQTVFEKYRLGKGKLKALARREVNSQREHQILKFDCHNMSDEQIKPILACMESLQCSLHIREEK